MSLDREKVDEYLSRVSDKYTILELIDILEQAGLIDINIIISLLEEEIIEAQDWLEV
jgi:hypothetical protein